MTRRDAARKMSLFLAGSPLLRAQEPAWIADRLPAIEALIYPSYWLECISARAADDAEIREMLSSSLAGSHIDERSHRFYRGLRLGGRNEPWVRRVDFGCCRY